MKYFPQLLVALFVLDLASNSHASEVLDLASYSHASEVNTTLVSRQKRGTSARVYKSLADLDSYLREMMNAVRLENPRYIKDFEMAFETRYGEIDRYSCWQSNNAVGGRNNCGNNWGPALAIEQEVCCLESYVKRSHTALKYLEKKGYNPKRNYVSREFYDKETPTAFRDWLRSKNFVYIINLRYHIPSYRTNAYTEIWRKGDFYFDATTCWYPGSCNNCQNAYGPARPIRGKDGWKKEICCLQWYVKSAYVGQNYLRSKGYLRNN